jgi:hypothetical protein
LRGTTLFFARLAWLLVAVFSLGIFLVAAPYHIIIIVEEILIVAGYTFTALLIFKHKSNDWMTIWPPSKFVPPAT